MPIAKLLGLLVQFALFPTPLIDAQLALATPAELSDPAAIAPDAAAPNIKPPVSRYLCCGTALCLPMGLPSRNDRPDVGLTIDSANCSLGDRCWESKHRLFAEEKMWSCRGEVFEFANGQLTALTIAHSANCTRRK